MNESSPNKIGIATGVVGETTDESSTAPVRYGDIVYLTAPWFNIEALGPFRVLHDFTSDLPMVEPVGSWADDAFDKPGVSSYKAAFFEAAQTEFLAGRCFIAKAVHEDDGPVLEPVLSK